MGELVVEGAWVGVPEGVLVGLVVGVLVAVLDGLGVIAAVSSSRRIPTPVGVAVGAAVTLAGPNCAMLNWVVFLPQPALS